MGSSYTLAADGTTPGSLYGIAWTHTNIGGQSKSGLEHQALFMTNGVTQTAIGSGIWTIGQITTMGSIYMGTGGTNIYLNGGTTYKINGADSYLDTMNSGATSDPLEINYRVAAPTKICASVSCATYSALFAEDQSVTFPGYLYTSGAYVRTNASAGYLSGNYPSAETSSTPGAIYTIGGSYYPSGSSLNNMYGIGYTHTNQGAMPSGASGWGMYVASAGTAKVWLSGDSGNINGTGTITAGSNLVAAGSLTLGTYGGVTETTSGYGTLSLSGIKAGYYGILMGPNLNHPNIMYDGSANGGIYNQGTGTWLQYYTASTKNLSINSSTDYGYKLGVNGSIYAVNDIAASGSVLINGIQLTTSAPYLRMFSTTNTSGGFELMRNDGNRWGYFYGDSSGVGVLNGAGSWAILANGSIGAANTAVTFYTGGTNRANIDSSGNFNFAASNPSINAASYVTIPGGAYFSSGTVYTEAPIQARGGIHNDSAGYLTVSGGTTGYTYFSGKVGIGKTAEWHSFSGLGVAELDLNGTSNAMVALGHGGVNIGYLYDDGNNMVLSGQTGVVAVQAYASGSCSFDGSNWGCDSDERLKENITPLTSESGLAGIKALRPVSYSFKAIPQIGTKLGFIAQEVQEVFPHAVSFNSYIVSANAPDGTYQLSYTELIAPAVLAIQELDARTNFISVIGTSTLATSSPVFALESSTGNIGIQTNTPKYALEVNGEVGAAAFVAPVGQWESLMSQMGFGTTTLATSTPAVVLTAGGDIDLYKLAVYNAGSIALLSERVAAAEERLVSLEARVQALEDGSIAVTSGTTSLPQAFATTLTAWLGDAGNQIGDIFAARFQASEKICVEDQCLTSDDVKALLDSVNRTSVGSTTPPAPSGDGSDGVGTTTPPTEEGPGDTGTSTPPTEDDGGDTGTTTPPGSDTTPPVVSLNGPAAVEIVLGDVWTDSGATALDETDGDLSAQIVVSGSVDSSVAGLYTITYSSTDAAGNTGSASRVVTVVAPSAS